MRLLVNRLNAACRTGLSPREIALTVALGTACAFFPILGLATPLCLGVGVVFRLNHPMLQTLNALTSPAYLPVIFGFMKIGDCFLGPAGTRIPAIAGHALVGWAVIAPFWISIVYLAAVAGHRLIASNSARAIVPAHASL